MSTAWALERSRLVTDIDHGTIINWVKEKGEKLPDEPHTLIIQVNYRLGARSQYSIRLLLFYLKFKTIPASV